MRTAIDDYIVDKVREIREEKDLSQKDLSYAVNKSKNFISKRENGTEKYNIVHINEIARVLGCSPKDFLPEKPFNLNL